MLPLVPDVVVLEPEEESEPVHQVVVVPPLHKRRLPEVTDGAQGCCGCAYLGVAEGGVVGEEVVDGDYIERLLHFRPRVGRSATTRGLRTLPEIHSLSCFSFL